MTSIPLTVNALCPNHGPVVQASLTELLRSYQYAPYPCATLLCLCKACLVQSIVASILRLHVNQLFHCVTIKRTVTVCYSCSLL